MIKIQVDLHPYGNAAEKRTISEIEIINIGGSNTIGYYKFIVDGKQLGQEIVHQRNLGVLVLLEIGLSLWNEEQS